MSVKFANNAHSTLASSVSTSATSITVASGHGARFPSLSSGEYFYATLIDTSNNLEIVKVTARSTDVLTATRAQESTSARAFASGDRIELRVTAQGITDATTIQADQVVNSMIATDAVNADSIAADSVSASEINVSGNGTAGQALLSDGDGSFSFGDSGGLIKCQTFEDSTRRSLGDSADPGAVITFTYNKVKDGSTTKLVVIGQISGRASYSDSAGQYFDMQTGGVSSHASNDSAAFKGVTTDNAPSTSTHGSTSINKTFQSTNLTVGNHTFEYGWRIRNNDSGNKPYRQINPNSSDDNRKHAQSSTFTVFEVLV